MSMVCVQQRSLQRRRTHDSRRLRRLRASNGNGEGGGGRVEVLLPTIVARREVVLSQLADKTYVSAVALDGEAKEAGIVPGQILRALSDPIKPNELWELTGTHKLRQVKDVVGTTRKYEIVLVFDAEEMVTPEMVEAASPEAEEYVAKVPESVTQDTVKTQGGEERVDRPDLYSEKWAGDVYQGSAVNELTVIAGLALGVPILGLLIAFLTRGSLWDVPAGY